MSAVRIAFRLPAVLGAALLAGGLAQAQLKPSRGSEPLTPPGSMASPPVPSQAMPSAPAQVELTAKEAAAVKSAGEWLKLIDAGEYGKSWDQSAPLFREKVPRQTWIETLPKNRSTHGKFKSRSFSAAQSRTSMTGAPEGEYVAVRFLADFEKASKVEEVVIMTYVGSAWRPIGYSLR